MVCMYAVLFRTDGRMDGWHGMVWYGIGQSGNLMYLVSEI